MRSGGRLNSRPLFPGACRTPGIPASDPPLPGRAAAALCFLCAAAPAVRLLESPLNWTGIPFCVTLKSALSARRKRKAAIRSAGGNAGGGIASIPQVLAWVPFMAGFAAGAVPGISFFGGFPLPAAPRCRAPLLSSGMRMPGYVEIIQLAQTQPYEVPEGGIPAAEKAQHRDAPGGARLEARFPVRPAGQPVFRCAALPAPRPLPLLHLRREVYIWSGLIQFREAQRRAARFSPERRHLK